MRTQSRWSAVALSSVLALSVLGVSPAVVAQSEPVFHLPFACGEVWGASTYDDHFWGSPPNDNPVDFNHLDADGDRDDLGKPVVAGADGGTVTVVGWDGPSEEDPGHYGYGNYVKVAYPGDIELLFAHLDTVTVSTEADPGSIMSNTQIGTVGSTGLQDRDAHHLHYEQRLNGVPRPVVLERRTLSYAPADDPKAGDVEWEGTPGVLHTSKNCSSTNGTSTAKPPEDKPPVSRPAGLSARVPWSAGEAHELIDTYDPDSPEGFGLTFAGEPGDAVYPLYKGAIIYAGCATGRSAPLGRIVVVRNEVSGHEYDTIYGHLDPTDPLPAGPVGTDDVIGHFGASVTSGTDCAGTEGGPTRLYLGMLRDDEVFTTGEISGGRPVYAEPLIGRGAYEGFTWWKGPATAVDMDQGEGSPGGRWANRSAKDGEDITFGDTVTLVAKVHDDVPIREVRFTAYYPEWARAKSAARLTGFDPKHTWRILAVCRPPGVGGEPQKTRRCTWDGTATDATVTYTWDPTAPVKGKPAPWQPIPRTAMSLGDKACVPVSLSFDIYDAAGYRALGPAGAKILQRCRKPTDKPGVVVNLRPLLPPAAPGNVRLDCYRGNPETGEQYLTDKNAQRCLTEWINDKRVLKWADDSNNEVAFRIYARYVGVNIVGARCNRGFEPLVGPWVRIADLPSDTTRWVHAWAKTRNLADFDPYAIDLRVASVNPADESPSEGFAAIPFTNPEPRVAFCGQPGGSREWRRWGDFIDDLWQGER